MKGLYLGASLDAQEVTERRAWREAVRERAGGRTDVVPVEPEQTGLSPDVLAALVAEVRAATEEQGSDSGSDSGGGE